MEEGNFSLGVAKIFKTAGLPVLKSMCIVPVTVAFWHAERIDCKKFVLQALAEYARASVEQHPDGHTLEKKISKETHTHVRLASDVPSHFQHLEILDIFSVLSV